MEQHSDLMMCRARRCIWFLFFTICICFFGALIMGFRELTLHHPGRAMAVILIGGALTAIGVYFLQLSKKLAASARLVKEGSS